MFGIHLRKDESFFFKSYGFGNFPQLFHKKTFNPKKYRDIAEYRYRTFFLSWVNNGASDALMNQMEFLETSDTAWLTEVKSLWLIYVSCLLQRGNKDEALRVLQKYHYCFGTINIPYFLPVANLAYENGISDDKIELAHNLFLYFEQQQKKNSLEEKLLNAKSIAIVGNAPNELGKNKGKEIDSHDLVIRLNKFLINGFEQDYGSKVDVWIANMLCLYDPPRYTPIIPPLSALVYSYWNCTFQIHLFKTKSITDYPLYFSTAETLKQIRTLITPAVPQPSTGYSAILWIYSLLKSFNKIDIYGFSFLNEDLNQYGYYYAKKVRYRNLFPKKDELITLHNFQQECINLKKLYTNE